MYLNATPISNPIVNTESANIALSTSIFVALPELRFGFKVLTVSVNVSSRSGL